jgi:hypothetical protein
MKYILIFLLICSVAYAESYNLMNDGYVQRESDLALIPPTTENLDYVKFLDDLANGAELGMFDYDAENARQLAAQQKLEEEQQAETLIQEKIRELAVASLKTEGKLDQDGKVIKGE